MRTLMNFMFFPLLSTLLTEEMSAEKETDIRPIIPEVLVTHRTLGSLIGREIDRSDRSIIVLLLFLKVMELLSMFAHLLKEVIGLSEEISAFGIDALRVESIAIVEIPGSILSIANEEFQSRCTL